MLFHQCAVLAAVAALSTAAPAPAKHVVHEVRRSAAADWVKGARIEPDAVLPVRIGLTQTNLDRGEAFLVEV